MSSLQAAYRLLDCFIAQHITHHGTHYRAYNPWVSNFHVVLCKGALLLLLLNDSGDPLEPLADGSFRIFGPHSPERVHFDTIVEGKALCAQLAGGDYYRVSTR